jgi:hypothetical protein
MWEGAQTLVRRFCLKLEFKYFLTNVVSSNSTEIVIEFCMLLRKQIFQNNIPYLFQNQECHASLYSHAVPGYFYA